MEEDLTFELWLIKNNYERDLRSKEAQNAATPGNGNEEKKDSQVIRKVERNLKEEKTCSEHMVCGKDVEIDADNCNLGQHGRKRKEKDFTEELNGINKEGDQKKSNSSLISLDLASAKESDLLLPESTKVEECSGTKQVECKREMNAGVDLGISADGDTNGHCVSDDGIKVDGSSGERTRKKMRIEEEGAGDGDGDADNNGREEKVSIFVSRSSDSIKDSSVSSKKEVAEERIKSEDPKDVKEERKGFDASDDPDVGANVNCEHNDNADEKMGHKKGKGKRGRKRKKVETEKSNEDSSYEREKVNEVPLDYNTPNTGRVLRSRTMPMSSGGKAVDIVSQKKRNATGIALGTQSSGKRGRKKLERRGRPRKYITDSKEEAEFPEGKKKKDAIGIGLSTQSSGRRGRKKQERRGRPRKQTTDSNEEAVFPVAKKKTRASKVMGDEEQKVIEGSMSVIDCGNDRLDSDSHQDGESINGKQLKTSHHNKEGNMGRREEKQLVREKIISLITKAGWNIQYRPRQGTERFDAVYCDREGRTYWSITLAYKMLKMKAESGEADDQTVSAFSPIPEEELEKLYKKMNKKRRDKGEPRSAKAIKGIKVAKNKIIKTGGSRMKEEIKSKRLRDKSSKKKRKHLHAERKESVRRSGRRVLKPFQERRRGGKPCALLARIADKVSDSDSCLTYDGKRSLLSWMIDLGTIPHKVDVQYKEGRKRRVMLDGRITRDGIHCGCCDEILTVLDFEVHSGSKMCQAFKNIYLLSGKSLLQCLRDSWSRQEESDHIGFRFVDVNGDDPNDDTCNLCGDGGDLICCDSCPSTFHQSCLDIQEFPTDDWNCVYCSCKFCATVAGKASTRNDDHDNVVDELLMCHMCNEKFHQLCLQESGAIQADSSGQSFCGRKCKKLFEQLQVLVGVKHELEEGFSWSLLRRSDICEDKLSDAQIECNSKLAVAFSIMDECFVPIIDERSGINMIHNVVFNCGSNFSRLNYSGFFTVILERGDEIFCAASIRMHGNQLAEMPFIGTRYIYRRQGMCRRLLTAIESALASLDVDNLVIPAIPELLQTWTSVFGFSPLEKSKRKEMRCMNMIVFPGIDILEKPLLKSHSPRETNAPFDSTSHLLDGSINEASSLTSDAKEEATVDDTRNEEAKICNHKPDSPDESSPAAFDGGCEARISCMDNEPEPSCRVEVSHEACCEVKLKEECVGGESESCSPDGGSVPGTQLCSEISEQPGSPVCLTAGSVCAAKSSAAQASVLT